MPITLIIAAVIGIVGILGYGTIQVQHANNVKLVTQRDAAYNANKSYQADMKRIDQQCKDATKVLLDLATKNGQRAAALQKQLAANRAAAGPERAKIDADQKIINDPTLRSKQEQCDAIADIAARWAADSLRDNGAAGQPR